MCLASLRVFADDKNLHIIETTIEYSFDENIIRYDVIAYTAYLNDIMKLLYIFVLAGIFILEL